MLILGHFPSTPKNKILQISSPKKITAFLVPKTNVILVLQLRWVVSFQNKIELRRFPYMLRSHETHFNSSKRTWLMYRHMYLKTYAKFTLCIKSQGHVSDENFLYYCMHLAHKISSYSVWNIYDKKTHFYLLSKFSIFFNMYLKTYTDIFSHILKMITPRALRQLLLFIALNCLTSATFIANLCSYLIPVHYKTSTTCTSKRTF